MPILGIIASAISGNLSVPSYDSIATTTVGSGGAASITFSSIPATYTHLQIRGITRPTETGTSGSAYVYLRVNSDSGSNYSRHFLYGEGTVGVQAGASQTEIRAAFEMRDGFTANCFAALIVDVLDYANTNKYKTVRTLSGFDTNGLGYIALGSGLWMNTNATTSLTFTPEVGNFKEYSTLALYGIKGA